MNHKVIKYGTEYLDLTCDSKVLNEIIDKAFEDQDISFSFRDFYNHIKRRLEENDYLQKEHNVEYSSIELRFDVIQSINKFLWDKIWAKQLMIDFSNRNVFGRYSNDDYMFVRVDKNEMG